MQCRQPSGGFFVFEQLSVQQTSEELKTDARKGLSHGDAATRLKEDGPNAMREPRKKTVIESFLEQLNDPLIYVLIVAAVVSILLEEVSDAAIIGVVVVSFTGLSCRLSRSLTVVNSPPRVEASSTVITVS